MPELETTKPVADAVPGDAVKLETPEYTKDDNDDLVVIRAKRSDQKYTREFLEQKIAAYQSYIDEYQVLLDELTALGG